MSPRTSKTTHKALVLRLSSQSFARMIQNEPAMNEIENEQNITTICVRFLSLEVTEEELVRMFARFGDITSIKMLKQEAEEGPPTEPTSTSFLMAFLVFTTRQAAAEAIEGMELFF